MGGSTQNSTSEIPPEPARSKDESVTDLKMTSVDQPHQQKAGSHPETESGGVLIQSTDSEWPRLCHLHERIRTWLILMSDIAALLAPKLAMYIL